MNQSIIQKIFDDTKKCLSINNTHLQLEMSTPKARGKENYGNNLISEIPKTPTKSQKKINFSHTHPNVPLTPTAQVSSTKSPSRNHVFKSQNGVNVKVYLRIRPLLDGEEQANFNVDSETKSITALPPPRSQAFRHYAEREFTFTDIFQADRSQNDVFQGVAMPLLKELINNHDALLFAYGATSAGKTFTVQGTNEEPGLLPKMLKTLLALEPIEKDTENGLLASCVELYNERLYDLFGDNTRPLRLGRDGFGYTSVKDAKEIEIKTNADIKQLLQDITIARSRASTTFNAQSSRSHCIFMLKFIQIPLDASGHRILDPTRLKCSRLSVVDLAGSERVTSEDNHSKTISEACSINKSMLVLGRCIRELRNGKNGQVPFRESKLTELFRDFFDTGARPTACGIIVNISPSTNQFDDTLFSLQFAAEAVKCKVRDDNEDDLIRSIDFADDDGIEDDSNTDPRIARISQETAQIYQELREEMNERIKKIQSDMQVQIEQIKAQSAQPYTSKLQRVLASRLQNSNLEKEIEECRHERDREISHVHELEVKLSQLKSDLEQIKIDYESEKSRNNTMQNNIERMMDATKKLHARHLSLMSQLEEKKVRLEDSLRKREDELISQLNVLKGKY